MWRLLPSLGLTILLAGVNALAAPAASSPSPSAIASPKPTLTPTATVAPHAPAPTPTPSPAGPLDSLSQAELQQALDFIRKNYVAAATLTPAEMDRATLAGLIDRLGRGVTLLPASTPAPGSAAGPLFHEILAGHIGYLRPSALHKSDLGELENALRAFAGKKVDALILDLRTPNESEDFALAANFAGHFVAKGKNLFALRGPAGASRIFTSEQPPAYTGFITVLIDRETAGAAEVLASVLRTQAKAILIGEASAGGAVAYSDLPLSGGIVLRVAVTEAMIGDERIGFPGGVQPDLPVAMPLATKRAIFAESASKGMAAYVFENERPHLNEAALLAGTNPEIEAIQAAQERRARGEKPPLHDPVVQRAVDVITSIGVYEKQPERTP